MGESLSGSDLLNALAHEFAERYRRGERPELDDYSNRYPELATEIRELFPALMMIEQLGTRVDQHAELGAERARAEGPVPERLGDFRIIREIGRGGMGIVYEAVQESLGRHVALKVLAHHRHFGPTHLLRFEREAKAAALLHHTNIVPVFGVGEHEGVHYYAMQYIQGKSLDVVLREVIRQRASENRGRELTEGDAQNLSANLASGLLTQRLSALRVLADGGDVRLSRSTAPGAAQTAPLTPARAASAALAQPEPSSSIFGNTEAKYFRSVARVGIQVAEAIAYAHLHGVLHRDIKPANLLLDLQGTIWVTDFGLAKSEGSEELTTAGDVVGTLRYLAPERFEGVSEARSDIYSLGLTLYEMMTLRPAFTASGRAQLISAILHDEPARPRQVDPQIPRDLETIVLKAIAKNPADRFPSAVELARELGRFVEGRPIRSRRVSLPERIWRWSRRNPAPASLALLASALTCLLLAGALASAWTFREQLAVVRAEKGRTQENYQRAVRAERERAAELGRSLVRQARAVRYSGQPGRRHSALETLTRAAQIAGDIGSTPEQLAELRDEVIAALALVEDRPVKSSRAVTPEPREVAYCVDADRLVTAGRDGLLHVRRISDGAELRVLGTERPAARLWPVFVPGGRFVSVRSGPSQIELWDIERGVVPTAWPADVRCAAARADGRQIALVRPDGELRVYDLPAMTEASRFRLGIRLPKRIWLFGMSFSDDGHRLALMFRDESVGYVYDVATGRVVLELELPSARVFQTIAINRNGGMVAVVHDRAISVYDVADGERLSLLQGHQSEGISAHFQPWGGLLATAGWDGTTRLWDPIRGRLLVTIPGLFCDWTDNGSSLAVVVHGTDLTLYQIAAELERRTIDYRMLGDRAGAALYGPARVAFSPDGRLIAMAARPEGVRIARASDGVGLAYLPIGDCDETLFLPGGDLLTLNDRGLVRWPVRRRQGGSLRMGPPAPLALFDRLPDFYNRGLGASASGRLIGVTSTNPAGSVLLDPEQPGRRVSFLPHDAQNALAISLDGRWAASGAWGDTEDSRQLKIWDVRTARLLEHRELGTCDVAFSPDGRVLGVSSETEYQFLRTGSWASISRLEHGARHAIPLAFHPGSRIAATVDTSRSRVRLVEVETGRVLAALEGTGQAAIFCLAFSPDGRYLAAGQSDQRVDVWDLASIRHRLDELGLASGLPDIFNGRPTPGIRPPSTALKSSAPTRQDCASWRSSSSCSRVGAHFWRGSAQTMGFQTQ
jgi:serine/threonine protein kinase/WD40 repeat protein